jgi:hypothetical protein
MDVRFCECGNQRRQWLEQSLDYITGEIAGVLSRR